MKLTQITLGLLLSTAALTTMAEEKASNQDQLDQLVEQKKQQAFPLPSPIRDGKYSFEVKLTERPDGLLVKAESEYEKAYAHTQKFMETKFSWRLPEKYKQITLTRPTPSTKGLYKEENIVYATWDKRAMMLDVYGPDPELQQKRPVILLVHGGGWGRGSHRNYRHLAVYFAQKGYFALPVEYRLSGEAPIPAAIFDLKAAVRWVRANAQKYNFDPDAIGITGGSAGGHLSALTAFTDDDIRFEGPANNLEYSSRINAVLSFYGPFRTLFNQTIGTKIDGRITISEAFPHNHITKGGYLPPLLCINENYHRENHSGWGKSSVDWINTNTKSEANFYILDAPHGYLHFDPFCSEAVDYADAFFKRVLKK